VVRHRLLGQDETAHGRVLGFDIQPDERNGRERLNNASGARRRVRHDTFYAIIRRWDRNFVDTKQHISIGKLFELNLTDSANAWLPSFS